ncbi:18.5 kDa class I heat shock protein-like [Carya illinoinensis]|uniref:18.5 kDa class I heat shock protein-like n=1 Tax=Carya illinoinensis TaxID=32201 RepID=UPI001C71C89B|nr:18.5 kDa class I heat shock protein-like [Carya illinoinensis]
MSIMPIVSCGPRSSVFDPFSLDFTVPSSLSTSSPLFSQENSAFVNTRIDRKETSEGHVFKADLPGLKEEEVKVEVDDERVIQISGERNVEKEDKNDKWLRVERSSGKFVRRFRLLENVKMDQGKTSMDNGVLTVTIPKEGAKKPDVKVLEILNT